MFKKARPARPQAHWRAERTRGYVSTTRGRERRWRLFSTSWYVICPFMLIAVRNVLIILNRWSTAQPSLSVQNATLAIWKSN